MQNLVNPIELYLIRLAPSSRRSMLSYLWVFAEFLGYQRPEHYIINSSDGSATYKYPPIEWANVTVTDVTRYLDHLRSTNKTRNHERRHQKSSNSKKKSKREPTTIKLHLVAIKNAINMATRNTGIDPQFRASKDLKEDIGQLKVTLPKNKRKVAIVDDDSFELLLDVNDPGTAAGSRNRAILYVMRYCGLRVEEVTNLMFPGSLAFEDRTLTVDGKGSKQRQVPMNEDTEVVICDWLELHRGELTGPLFTRVRKGDTLVKDPMTDSLSGLTPSGVDHIISQSSKKAGLGTINTHDFRRTFATQLFAKGTDPFTVCELMGHGNVETAMVYDMRDDKRKFDAIDSQ